MTHPVLAYGRDVSSGRFVMNCSDDVRGRRDWCGNEFEHYFVRVVFYRTPERIEFSLTAPGTGTGADGETLELSSPEIYFNISYVRATAPRERDDTHAARGRRPRRRRREGGVGVVQPPPVGFVFLAEHEASEHYYNTLFISVLQWRELFCCSVHTFRVSKKLKKFCAAPLLCIV